MTSPTAFITGIGGQDGSYLAELLIASGYHVTGVVRPGWVDRNSNLGRVQGVAEVVSLDLASRSALEDEIARTAPSVVFHLAADSFVPDADEIGIAAAVVAAENLIAAVCLHAPHAAVVNASSVEIFGDAPHSPQSESTPIAPRTSYGKAKARVFEKFSTLREDHGIQASSAVLFNHESPRRPGQFVTMKVARAAAAIAAGHQDFLELGSLEPRRDWSHARDVVRALKLIAEAPVAEDFVIASGVSHSVGELVEIAFRAVGCDWRDHVRISAAFERPPEAVERRGDATRARDVLGWVPMISFEEMILEMVNSEVRRLAT